MLSLVLGSATHSFELMLSAFILGLALGAFWIRRRSDGHAPTHFAQLAHASRSRWALLAVATLPLYADVVPLDGRAADRGEPHRGRIRRLLGGALCPLPGGDAAGHASAPA